MPELLQEWVTFEAGKRPDNVAIRGDEEAITYAQLETGSNRLARLLKDSGCRRGDPVCLLMPKCPTALVGLLAIYKADGIYVPLDPYSPPARLGKILSACGSRWVLGGGPGVAPLLEGVLEEPATSAGLSIGWMGAGPGPHGSRLRAAFTLDDTAGYSPEPLQYGNRRGDPAHILFTSGSTGTPKGVVITHANVIHFVEWAVRYFGIVSSDRNSGHPPLSFDLSIFDIFGTFAAGAQLFLVPAGSGVDPVKLAAFIRDMQLTQWFSVPSLLHYMARFDVLRADDFPALKRLLWCGEVFPTPSLVYWMRKLPHVQFTNLYGPTETTIASSYYTVPRCPDDETAAIPIGAACDGEELLVLGDTLRRLPPGEDGELCIRGAGLSRGYWNDAEATNRVFVHLPDGSGAGERLYRTGDLARLGHDGLVYLLGRKDSQIKSRGYRIELGEIEAALNALEVLKESAVVTISGTEAETTIICCAYVPASGTELPPAALRRLLSRSLPNYMLPIRWRILPLLPRNSSGKIDRRALKEDFIHHSAHSPRSSPAQSEDVAATGDCGER
jgi:amino acid adenylation domain-containing protein